jgi:hypothetical protein
MLACLLLTGMANAAPSIALSLESGPPTTRILASGNGFQPDADVNVYFDFDKETQVVTDAQGQLIWIRGQHPTRAQSCNVPAFPRKFLSSLYSH